MATITKAPVDEVVVEPTELDLLKTQADILKISYRANISAQSLRREIMATLQGDDDSEGISSNDRQELEEENLKLVRCIVMPVASHMREYQGQLFSVGNAVLGVVSKFVLFNSEYHVPNIILKHIQAQEMQYFITKRVNNEDVRVSKMRKAYNVDILDPLTEEELTELARSQENRQAIDA